MALTAKKVYAILKRQISDMEAKIKTPIIYRGTVATADLLPLNPDIGDMYNIESKSVYGEAGMNVAWNGVVWDTMGAPIDMSLYIKSNELADWVKQQNKPTYTAEEVGALPDTTVIPSKTSDLQNDSGFLTKIPDNYLSGTDKTLSAPGKAADAKAVGDKNVELLANILSKLDKNQGSENSGKIAGINESGDIVPMFPVSVDYNEETNCLEFGSDQKMELNKGINLDSTLTKTGYAADAGAVGEITDSLKEDLIKKVHVYDDSFLTGVYGDANTVPVYSIVTYTYIDGVKNIPVNERGVLISLSIFKKNVATIQEYIEFENNNIWYRNYSNNTWKEWNLITKDNAVFTVGVNKQFQDPVTCFKTIQNYDFHKKVLIYSGEYDIYNLMGGHDHFSNFDSSQSVLDVQPWLNNVEIIGVGDVVLKMHIPSDIPKSTTWLFSPINIRGDATIKNITVEGSNIRYCIHDESGKKYPYTKRLYENVNCTIDEHVAIGGGYSTGTKIKMINCNLRSEAGGAYSYHSKGGIVFDAQNCIFSTGSNVDSAVRFSEENTEIPDRVTLSNCYLDGKSSIEIRGEWDYSPAIGYTDIKLINTKAENINNGYNSNNKPVVSYNTISGGKNTIIPVN